ncbi:MAG: hypothetical protein IT289_01060 [Oligoflexia bacterium]|nr:hypothetical protein [Oligoflexia bacterium]
MTIKRVGLILFCLSLLFTWDKSSGQLLVSYKPVNITFWRTIEDAIRDKNYDKGLSLAQEQHELTKKDSLENGEAWLGFAQILQKQGFFFASSTIFGDLMKTRVGTELAIEALKGLESNLRFAPIDDDYFIGELINDLEFGPLPPELQDLVSFQEGMFNLIHGFKKWSDDDFKKITAQSYWDYRLRYLTALGEVARNRVDSAIEKFQSLAEDTKAPEDIKDSSTHNMARLIFEKGDYTRSYKIFRTVKLNDRERGMILLERAWAKYYQKDYAKALGLLAAMEAPVFEPSRTPEPYILRMVIYKELCYYQAALDVAREVNIRFGQSIKSVYERKDIRKDPVIVRLALLDRRIEKWAELLNSLREELDRLGDHSWEDYAFYPKIKKRYESKIREVLARLDYLMIKKSRDVGNQLIDWQEQVNFLDYQTRLDSLRVTRPGTQLNYRVEEIPHLTFEKIYWTNTGEHWMDEMETYKVFVESRCALLDGPVE